MSAPITLSVVSHGHAVLLARLLQELNAQPALTGVKVIVTLNLASEKFDPGTYENLDIFLIRNAVPKGFGANHNAAFRHCMTPWFAVINPDLSLSGAEPFTHLLSVATLEKLGGIAPRVVNEQGDPEDAVRTNLTLPSLLRRHLLGHKPLVDARVPARRGADFFWLAGMCVVLNSEAFRAVKGFDEAYFLYCEDYDLCARLYLAGFGLGVDVAAQIIHDARRDSHRAARHLRWHIASLVRVWLSSAFWRLTLRLY